MKSRRDGRCRPHGPGARARGARGGGLHDLGRGGAAGFARHRAGHRRARRHRAARRRGQRRRARGDLPAREGILDFTTPKSTVEFAGLAANARVVHVIGTTGLDDGRRSADRGCRPPRPHHQGRQHEPRRQPAGGRSPAAWRKRWTRTSTSRSSRCTTANKVDAPSGTALDAGRRGGGRARCQSRRALGERPRRHHRTRVGAATSVSPACAAAASSATTG